MSECADPEELKMGKMITVNQRNNLRKSALDLGSAASAGAVLSLALPEFNLQLEIKRIVVC